MTKKEEILAYLSSIRPKLESDMPDWKIDFLKKNDGDIALAIIELK